MKKRRLLYIIPLASLLLSSCSVKGAYNRVRGWFDNNFFSLFNEKTNQNDEEKGERKEDSEQHEDEHHDPEVVAVEILAVHVPELIEQGSEIDLSQFTADVLYSDGTQGTIVVDSVDLDLTNPDDNATGTVHVGDVTATFTIEVIPSNPTPHHGTFVTDEHTTITSESDHVNITLTNNADENDQINIKTSGTELDGGALTAPANSYVVLQNKADSPLNDFSQMAFSWNHDTFIDDEEEIGIALYLSYHYLTLDNILAGRYADLQTFLGTLDGVEGLSFGADTDDEVQVSGVRYFLLILQTPSCSDVTFTSFTVTSNQTTPPPVIDDIGYFTAYPEHSVDFLGEGFEHGLPFVGNGSFMVVTDEGMITLQRKGHLEDYLEYFLEEGYVYATDYEEFVLYQKPIDGENAYTYGFTYMEIGDLESYSIVYGGINPIMIEEDAFDLEKVRSAFVSDEFKLQITDPCLQGPSLRYIHTIQRRDTRNRAEVEIKHKQLTREQFATNTLILRDYLQNFVDNYGYTYSYYHLDDVDSDEFEYYASAYSPQHRTIVEINVHYDESRNRGRMEIEYEERLYGAFPIELIREVACDNLFPDFTTSLGSFYHYGDDHIEVSGIDVTEAELETYLEQLTAYGFTFATSYASEYKNYSGNKYLVINGQVYCFYAYFAVYEDRIDMQFYKYSTGYAENLFDALINCGWNSNLAGLFVSSSGISTGEFSVNYSTNTIFCNHFGATEAQAFLDACTYDPVLKQYVFYNESNAYDGAVLIDTVVEDGYIKLICTRVDSYEWEKYHVYGKTPSEFNAVLAENFDNFYVTTDLALYQFSTDANTVIYGDYSYEVYGADAHEIVEAYLANLLASGHVKYSTFMNAYVNLENGVSVQVFFDENYTLQHYRLYINYGISYVDYVPYAELEPTITDFNYLDKFPTLDVVGDDPAYVKINDTSDSLTVAPTQDAYNAFMASVSSDDGFYYNENANEYEKVDENGNSMVVSVSWEGYITISYRQEYYTTIEVASLQLDDSSWYPNIPYPTQSGKIFRARYAHETEACLEFDATRFDKDAYYAYLENAGWTLCNESGDVVIYTNYINETIYTIAITNKQIIVSCLTFDLLTYDKLCETLENNGFETEKLDDFVTIPGMEGNYVFSSAYQSGFDIFICNPEVTREAYENALEAAGYLYNPADQNWTKGDVTVVLSDQYNCVQIEFYDSSLVYRTMADILSRAENSPSCDSWVLQFFLYPTQAGKLYALNFYPTKGLSVFYNADFDEEAYIDELLEDGYTMISQGCYRKDNSVIQVGGGQITFTYDGLNRTSVSYYNQALNSHLTNIGDSIDGTPVYPSASLNLEIAEYGGYSIVGDDGFYQIQIVLNDSTSSYVYDREINGNIVTEFIRLPGSNNAVMNVYDLSQSEEQSIKDLFYNNLGIYIYDYDGFDLISGTMLSGNYHYFTCADAEEMYNTLYTAWSGNTGTLYEFNTYTNYFTFKTANVEHGFIVELINSTTLRISDVYLG